MSSEVADHIHLSAQLYNEYIYIECGRKAQKKTLNLFVVCVVFLYSLKYQRGLPLYLSTPRFELVFGSDGRTCLCDFQSTVLRYFGIWHPVVWWTHQVFGLSYYLHLHSVVVYLFYPEDGGSRFYRNMVAVTKVPGMSLRKGVTWTRNVTIILSTTSVYRKVC